MHYPSFLGQFFVYILNEKEKDRGGETDDSTSLSLGFLLLLCFQAWCEGSYPGPHMLYQVSSLLAPKLIFRQRMRMWSNFVFCYEC